MKCPYCNHIDNKVLDSRLTPDTDSIRRRRECIECNKRFTTYERIEMVDISGVQKDGRSEPCDREKVMKGVLRACEKRPIKRQHIEDLVSNIEITVRQTDKLEIKRRKI